MNVLFLCHSHPELQPGGTEAFSRALFRELRDHQGIEGTFLAATTQTLRRRNPGTLLQAAPGGAVDELLVSLDRFDRFFLSQPDIYGLAASLPPLVERVRPDVIHVHHPLLFGTETIDLLRRIAPKAVLVATLHDYFAICPREGLLLTADGRLCNGPSPDRCRTNCFSERNSVDLTMRALSVRGAFKAFDGLVAPSRFLRERFLAAGWEDSRIVLLHNGVHLPSPVPHRAAPDGRRDRFAFFGHINRFKGSLVALAASARVSAAFVPHTLALHGGTAHQPKAFLEEFDLALGEARDADYRGPYGSADLPMRMASADWIVVPSVWWENAPLVIMEAFAHRRPVICSGIGGMAELVRDGVNGLHAPVNDPEGLAAVMRRAATSSGLWDKLVDGIEPPRGIAVAAEEHMELYRTLSARKRRAPRAASRAAASRTPGRAMEGAIVRDPR